MKPTLAEDVASIGAIAFGAVLSAGLTAALLVSEPAPTRTLRGQVVEERYIHFLLHSSEHVLMSGPDGLRSCWTPSLDAPLGDVVRGVRPSRRFEGPERPAPRPRGR